MCVLWYQHNGIFCDRFVPYGHLVKQNQENELLTNIELSQMKNLPSYKTNAGNEPSPNNEPEKSILASTNTEQPASKMKKNRLIQTINNQYIIKI